MGNQNQRQIVHFVVTNWVNAAKLAAWIYRSANGQQQNQLAKRKSKVGAGFDSGSDPDSDSQPSFN